jgi:hypothetical protein
VQALLDEIKLQQSGATDATSNVRAGKLIRAGRVVQGSLQQLAGTSLRADAAVVDVPTSRITGTAQNSNLLDQVFDIEKRLALDLFAQLGVTLTVAERNAVEQRPTRLLAAFLSYSRGLAAEDEGRFDDAARYFSEAARLDPSFGAAQQKSQEVKAVSAGTGVNAASVEVSLKGTSEGAVVSAATQGTMVVVGVSGGTSSIVQATAGDLNPSPTSAATGVASVAGVVSQPAAKDAVSAGTGSDNPTGTAKVTIIIARPKVP